jgi:hypothetical protein
MTLGNRSALPGRLLGICKGVPPGGVPPVPGGGCTPPPGGDAAI